METDSAPHDKLKIGKVKLKIFESFYFEFLIFNFKFVNPHVA